MQQWPPWQVLPTFAKIRANYDHTVVVNGLLA